MVEARDACSAEPLWLSKAGANERGWCFTVRHLRDSVRGSTDSAEPLWLGKAGPCYVECKEKLEK